MIGHLAKRRTWEARLISHLLRRRMLAFVVVVLLQALLVAGVVGLLWMTKVKDTVTANAVVGGEHVVALQEATGEAKLLVELGQRVDVGQPMAVVAGAQVVAPVAGIAWGRAFGSTSDASQPGAPYLSIVPGSNLTLYLTVRDQDQALLPAGAEVAILEDQLTAQAAVRLRGVVLDQSLPDGQIAVAIDPSQATDAAWQSLGALLASGGGQRVTVEARTRRLLSQLVQR